MNYNEITVKKIIEYEGEVYEVLSSWVFRKQQRKPVNQAKLRNLRTGGMLEVTFHQNDKVDEADLEKKTIEFVYAKGDEYVFTDPKNPRERFNLSSAMVGDGGKFLKSKTVLDAVLYDEEIIKVLVPIKVDLKVTEAPPNVKGNTAQGGNKLVTLETGAKVLTPMFINEGDIISVNTETAEYTGRASKE